MKGWYGKREQHSLASKGIKTKQLKSHGYKGIFPTSYLGKKELGVKIKFDDDSIMLLPTHDFFYNLRDRLPNIDMSGEKLGEYVTIEKASVPFSYEGLNELFWNDRDVMLKMLSHIYGKEATWYNIANEDEIKTKFYPSLKGKSIVYFDRDTDDVYVNPNKNGVIIDEYTYFGNVLGHTGYSTKYKIKLENDKELTVFIHNIKEIEGKDPRDLVLFETEGNEAERVMGDLDD